MRNYIILLLLASCMSAQAGPLAPAQRPDTWSNPEFHIGGHGVIGVLTGSIWPKQYVKAWAVCQIPGAIHEFAPSRGNTRSNRDLLMNSVGCGLGVWAGNLQIQPSAGGARILYSQTF